MRAANSDLIPASAYSLHKLQANLVTMPSSTKHALQDVAIAIASDSLQQRSKLRKLMEQAGLNVVLSEPMTRLFLHKLSKAKAEVLLLDLHDEQEHDDELLYEVLDKVEIPIIFNDVTALLLNEPAHNTRWQHSLMQKIAESTGITGWQPAPPVPPVPQPAVTSEKPAHGIARNVWVLGASLGGPEALKRFLSALPDNVPAAFILAQHLGANFVGLLAEQLNRVTRLRVMPPREGHLLQHQEVVIAPVSERLTVNPIGNIELDVLHEQTSYTPSIDMVISDAAKRYGRHAGAIIFSGMCDDGKRGCQNMLAQGGQVWLQTAESCVISSMPDNVKQVCQPQFIGNPEQLASQLVKYLRTAEVR